MQLAPAFASTAIKRLQTSLALLPARQLVQALWSFAAIGYTPLAPQLKAYQQRVRGILCVGGWVDSGWQMVGGRWWADGGWQMGLHSCMLVGPWLSLA